MFTTGGEGFIYIGFVKNLRVGGMGFSGSISSSAKINNENLEAVYSIGGGLSLLQISHPTRTY